MDAALEPRMLVLLLLRSMLEDPEDELLLVSLCANADPDASAIQQSAAAIGVLYIFICMLLWG